MYIDVFLFIVLEKFQRIETSCLEIFIINFEKPT